MRRPFVLAVVCLVVAATVPLPVSAHSNHLTTTSQVTSDGTVTVETVFVSQRAHLVVHANDDGEMGEALGSRPLTPGGLQRNVEVAIDDDVWADWGENRSVWVALHADDGDGQYDADDPVFTLFDRPVAERVTVGKGDAALVTGRGFYGQTTSGPDLSVGRVTIPDDGFLVVRDDETDRVVGTQAVDAGTHEALTVGLDESYYAEQSGGFSVRAQVYLDDGDGTFDDADRLVRAGDAPVETTLPVSFGGSGRNETGDGAGVVTPGDPEVNTPAETTGDASPGPTDTATVGTDDSTPDTDASTGTGPGFGVVVALVAAVLASLVWFGTRTRP
ncbi:DUF7282 domain-containing protein [Halomarina oriensis]|uniref:DUF7282 domain-containing protein n=1 Tax=Halomarina oriensis TaxID=671145 RepID=A0A6B0GK47_9EURY|nr:hypothetical protein [Halomarina oriensis]MWG34980.1 hypothetical protein [Halomarina oriensis]